MSWLQVALPVTPQSLSAVEDALLAVGALSITLVSDAQEPVLEPAPGETPLWQEICLQALFAVDTDMQPVRLALLATAPGVAAQITFVGEQDWQAAAHSHSVNEIFAGKLWLRPKAALRPEEEIGLPENFVPPENSTCPGNELITLHLEPGLAFGSGGHPTTRLCLNWLAENVTAGMRGLDFGCGSGVLGLAAALMGARVLAVDHDPQAILATTANATCNSLTDKDLTTLLLDDWHAAHKQHEFAGSFDFVVANILAAPLQELAQDFESVAKPGAHIVLSGILPEQAGAVAACYQQTHFRSPIITEGWALLCGVVASP